MLVQPIKNEVNMFLSPICSARGRVESLLCLDPLYYSIPKFKADKDVNYINLDSDKPERKAKIWLKLSDHGNELFEPNLRNAADGGGTNSSNLSNR